MIYYAIPLLCPFSEINEKGITRSASFHGLRNRNGAERCSISGGNTISRSVSSRLVVNEDSNTSEAFNNVDDDDWIIPKPPSVCYVRV